MNKFFLNIFQMFNILKDLLWTGQFRSLLLYAQAPKNKQDFPENLGLWWAGKQLDRQPHVTGWSKAYQKQWRCPRTSISLDWTLQFKFQK